MSAPHTSPSVRYLKAFDPQSITAEHEGVLYIDVKASKKANKKDIRKNFGSFLMGIGSTLFYALPGKNLLQMLLKVAGSALTLAKPLAKMLKNSTDLLLLSLTVPSVYNAEVDTNPRVVGDVVDPRRSSTAEPSTESTTE
jgi:hypothetical protein